MKITQDHKIFDIVKGYKTPFHSIPKKGQGLKTSDKFEATEYIYPILSLQNERFAESEIHVAKTVLHVQTKLKRCIFFSSLEKKFKALCSLPLVRKLVQVPLPLLQFGTSTTNIHEIVKSANENSTQDKHQNYNLFRRHDKVDWLVDVNYSSSFTSKVELPFPPNATNIILSENLSHLDKIILNENSKIELKWWVQNLEI